MFLFLVFFVLFLRGLVGLFTGGSAFDSNFRDLTGMGWNQIVASQPGIATFIYGILTELSLILMGFGIFGMVVSRTSYRGGERWAWYVSWYLPLDWGGSILLGLTNVEGSGGVTIAYAAYILLLLASLLGLLLPYRKFFPKKQTATS